MMGHSQSHLLHPQSYSSYHSILKFSEGSFSFALALVFCRIFKESLLYPLGGALLSLGPPGGCCAFVVLCRCFLIGL